MTDGEPRTGDKIKALTHTELVGHVHEVTDDTVVVQAADGTKYEFDRDPERHSFMIVERADGPEKDLAGTVRSNGFTSYVKVCRNRWHVVLDEEPSEYTNSKSTPWYPDTSFYECHIVGFVPGSPADKAAKAKAAKAEPPMFRFGDGEPDRSLTLTNEHGAILKYGRYSSRAWGENPAAWWSVKNPRDTTFAPWGWWAKRYGPWTVLNETETAESKAA